MGILLVTYDLRKPGQDYAAFHKVIKGCLGWARLSESSYAVATAQTTAQLANDLRTRIDSNDQFYVIALSGTAQGWGAKEVNDWLQQNLS